MAVAMERLNSRSFSAGKSPRGEFLYAFTDVPVDDYDHATVYALAWAIAPPIWFNGLYKNNVDCDNQGAGVWYAKIDYGTRKPKEPGQVEWRLNIGTRTMRVTQSLETISRTPVPGKTATNHMGAINVADGRVEGVDRVIPTFEWEETHTIDYASITIPWLNTLYLLTGRTNNANWRFFDEGEVLFFGASGAPAGQQYAKFTFRFVAEPNLTNFDVGDITVPSKKGHEYLWIEYKPKTDWGAIAMARQPFAAYVERIYEAGNLASIGLPDPWA